MQNFVSCRWLAPAMAVQSLLACYGTLATTAVLGMLGVALALNDAVWAGGVVVLAWLAVPPLWLRRRRHGLHAPVALAAIGAALVTFAMAAIYVRLIEIAGFAFLGTGTWLDWPEKGFTRSKLVRSR